MLLLLAIVCAVTAVGALPVPQTQEATSQATDNVTVTSMLNVTTPANATASQVGGVSLNHTQKAGTATLMHVPQWASAETLEETGIVKEGDILLVEDRNAVQSLWLDATVPYAAIGKRESDFLAAFKMISDKTCIRFKEHTTEFNYLKFETGKGCASFVGCQGGAQAVYFNRDCSVGNLCHELIHALGLYHEHTRVDRDEYITVQWDSIVPGKENNFKVTHGDIQNLPYDIDSIMHYGSKFFSRDGNPTVVAKEGGHRMGQRSGLSNLDVKRLNKLYHCDKRGK